VELRSWITGEPTPMQEQLIEQIAALEWAARRAEASDTLVGERDGREHRRLLMRFVADFERTLVSAMVVTLPSEPAAKPLPESPAKPLPEPPAKPPTLADIVADRRR
jgi:hypothetical protein